MDGSLMRRLSLVSVVDITIAEVVATPALPKRISVRTVKASDTIAHAFEVLSNSKVVRAPLVDDAGKAFALVDVLDLMKYAVLDSVDETTASLAMDNLPRLQHKVEAAVSDTNSNRNKLVTFSEDDKLFAALEAFASGRHEILVTTKTCNGYMINQSDILKYLDEQPAAYKNLSGKSLGQLQLHPRRPLQTVPSSVTVAAAYRALYGSHAAVPIVDSDGRIVGTLSVTDLKYSDPADLSHLKMNVLEFLTNDEARGAGAPVSVSTEGFIGEVILLLSHAHVTRVWVVDEDKKPVGVVSCTDVIGKVLHFKNE